VRRQRRDNNESELVQLAEQLGATWIQAPPFDGFLFWRGRWHLCEVKRAEKEGWSSEFTPAQLLLIQKLKSRQVPWHVLRTEDDVYALLGARRTA
jgi:hypothetical protein